MNKILSALMFCLLPFFIIAQTQKNVHFIKLNTKDITPEFLSFYHTASKQNASKENRWKLWKSMYNFAATPPTPQGDSIAGVKNYMTLHVMPMYVSSTLFIKYKALLDKANFKKLYQF